MWKLDRLRKKVEDAELKLMYSQTNGIGTLSIHKGENIIEWWETEITDDEDLDDMITEAEQDFDNRINSRN